MCGIVLQVLATLLTCGSSPVLGTTSEPPARIMVQWAHAHPPPPSDVWRQLEVRVCIRDQWRDL